MANGWSYVHKETAVMAGTRGVAVATTVNTSEKPKPSRKVIDTIIAELAKIPRCDGHNDCTCWKCQFKAALLAARLVGLTERANTIEFEWGITPSTRAFW